MSRIKRLNEDFEQNSKLDLDAEMELWKRRSKDDFGKCLTVIAKKLADYEIGERIDFEYNVTSTPSEMIGIEYSLDGDMKDSARKMLYYLFSHDFAAFVQGKINSEIDGLKAAVVKMVSVSGIGSELPSIAENVYGK